MKAYEILMFLLLFNLVMWGFGALGIFNLEYGYITPPDNDESGLGLLATIAGVTIEALIISLTSYAIIGYITKARPSPANAIYGLFSGLFWTSYLNAIIVFKNMAKSLPTGVTLVPLAIFTAIVGYVFIIGLSQMVTGGWKSYK